MQMKTIASSIALCAALMAGGAASASTYAVSTTSITGFTMGFDTTKATLKPNTFAGDTAELNGVEDGYGALKDAQAVCLDCTYTNEFYAHNANDAFAYGDAQIHKTSVLSGTGAASSIGEASLLTAGTGHGYGTNTMTGTWTSSVAQSVTFSFSATSYMNAMTSGAGDSATAYSQMYITLVQGGTEFFRWAPGDLNKSLTATGAVPYSLGPSYFTMTTDSLQAGTYSLVIAMKNEATVSAVPVPAAVWLLGSGLIGLIGVARRKEA